MRLRESSILILLSLVIVIVIAVIIFLVMVDKEFQIVKTATIETNSVTEVTIQGYVCKGQSTPRNMYLEVNTVSINAVNLKTSSIYFTTKNFH